MSQLSHLYNSRRWRARRAEQLEREPLCRMCAELDKRVTAATVADHITPHNGDPALFEGPLQSLCQSCHSSRKQRQEKGSRPVFAVGLDGFPISADHPWNTGK